MLIGSTWMAKSSTSSSLSLVLMARVAYTFSWCHYFLMELLSKISWQALLIQTILLPTTEACNFYQRMLADTTVPEDQI